MLTVGLAHLLARGVRLQPHEAIAIGQELIGRRSGIPAVANVQLGSDGTAACAVADGTPSVSDIASLLDTLLPPGASRVPAPLRYAIARGLRAVEAPPFESLDDFSRALQRFEAGDRHEVVRSLLKRVAAAPRPAPAPRTLTVPAPRPAPAPDLAVADPLDLELRPASATIPVPSPRRRPGGAAVAVFASFAAGFALMEFIGDPSPPITPDESVSASAAGSASAPAAPTTAAAVERAVSTSGRKVERVPLDGPTDGPAFSPAFDSKGTAIFFHTGATDAPRSAIAVATSDSWPGADLGIMTVVDDGARNYHAQPSPDGRHVAFDSDRQGQRAIYVADRDGSHVRRISGKGYAAAPAWSHDGERLAYIRGEAGRRTVWNLWVQTLDGREPTRLTSYRYGQTWTASWFPDNRRIAYTHEDRVILLDLATGTSQQFDSPVKGRALRTPAVSPDGSAIIFQVFRHGAWLLDLADGSMRCVLEDPTAEEFAWAPDGRQVAFLSRRDGRWGIYLLSRG
jgi:hypothetical protein